MNPLLRDLLDHQYWADIELWNAIGAHEPARADRVIHDRLHHIHLVQRGFTWITGDRSAPFSFSTPEDFPSFDALKSYARETHDAARRSVESSARERGGERIDVPWFKDPPLTLTVTEALAQMAMHSQHHRGQNAARLRELGAVPPAIDLIVWYWKGRPVNSW
jgi:uncharacterized damage-inducible protein DinB